MNDDHCFEKNGIHEPVTPLGFEDASPNSGDGKRPVPRRQRSRVKVKDVGPESADQGACIPMYASSGGEGSGIFRDAEDMKISIRKHMLKPDVYDVKNHYHERGLFQRIARHHTFENVTLGVISLNAVWMGVDTDRNTADTFLDARPLFQVVDAFFCIYFTGELLIRFMAFDLKRNCLRSGWFLFDSVLVALMLMETVLFTLITLASGGSGGSPLGQSSILRLFRLLRLSRLTRILRGFPQLMILIKGMITAMKSVSYVMALLFIILYVFGIAFTQLSFGYLHETYFENVAGAMYSLMIHGTFLDDLADFCGDVKDEAPWLLLLVSIFIVLACLTVMNMLIGVLCQVISSVAETEKETLACEMVKEKLQKHLAAADQDDNDTISFEEMKKMLCVDEALVALQEVGVDPLGMIDFAEEFFVQDGEEKVQLSFEDFMIKVLDLRGTQTCKVKDLMLLNRRFEKRYHRLDHKLDKLVKALGTPKREQPLVNNVASTQSRTSANGT